MFTGIMQSFALIAHLVSTLVRVALPGGARAVIAESLLLKHQLLVLSRSRKRTPRLTRWERLLFGVGAFLVSPKRLPKIAVGISRATLPRFHRALTQRKYQCRHRQGCGAPRPRSALPTCLRRRWSILAHPIGSQFAKNYIVRNRHSGHSCRKDLRLGRATEPSIRRFASWAHMSVSVAL